MAKDYLYKKNGKIDRKEVMKKNRKTEYNGYMSDSTARKVRRIMTSWYKAIQFENEQRQSEGTVIEQRLTFMTLTLSDEQRHDDVFIKRNMLNRFIIQLQRKKEVINYLWKAEKMVNGRLHIHLVVDRYVEMKWIQENWNNIQNENGYLESFKKLFGRNNPPSTHIRAIDNEKDALDYVNKYMSKKEKEKIENGNKVKGRIWGCSDDLRDLKVFSAPEDSGLVESLMTDANEGEVRKVNDEFFEIYIVRTEDYLRRKCKRLYLSYVKYYLMIFNELYNMQLRCQKLKEVENQKIKDRVKQKENWRQLSLLGFEADIRRYE